MTRMRGLNRYWHGLAVAGLLGSGAGVAQAESSVGTFLKQFFSHGVNVVTVTDVTAAGKNLRQPTREKPVYYEALVIGYTDFGRSIAALEPPDKVSMLKLIVKLLADQGYYPATNKHHAEMLLALSWGTMNAKPGMALLFMGGDKLNVMWELEPLSIGNAAQALTRHARSPTAEFVVDAMSSNLYVISIQAYDEAEALQGRTKLLWHTKVSCPATGLDIEPTLRQMAREAAPFFGKEMAKPVWTAKPEREGRVDLGEIKVLETIDPAKLPITDVNDEPLSSHKGDRKTNQTVAEPADKPGDAITTEAK